MSNISISSPFIRKFNHDNVSVTTSWSTALVEAEAPQRRIVVIVQNKSDSASLEVVFNTTSTAGILVPPLSNISLDNYNGIVKVKGTAALTAHIAYATA
jgi:uncharacterized protein (DUF111 family)